MSGIERELEGKVQVIHLSVWSHVGRQAVAKFGVRALPTLILLDLDGQEASRYVGIPQKSRLLEDALALYH